MLYDHFYNHWHFKAFLWQFNVRSSFRDEDFGILLNREKKIDCQKEYYKKKSWSEFVCKKKPQVHCETVIHIVGNPFVDKSSVVSFTTFCVMIIWGQVWLSWLTGSQSYTFNDNIDSW